MKEGQISFHDAMKLLSGQKAKIGSLEIDEIETTYGQWLEKLMDKLRDPKLARRPAMSKKFKGTLRPYQSEGFTWLNTLKDLGTWWLSC